MTGPRTTVAPFCVRSKNLVFSLSLTDQNKAHWLRFFLKMAVISSCKLVLGLARLLHCPRPAHCWCRSGTSSPDREPVLWLSKSKEVVPEKALAPNQHSDRFGRTKEQQRVSIVSTVLVPKGKDYQKCVREFCLA